MPLLNWVEYQAQAGDFKVTIERDNNTSDNPGGRRLFRFQLDGPAASEIFDEVTEGGTPVIKFFHTARVTIAGVEVLVLRHGMAGHGGVEISGPYEHGETVRAVILQAGAKHGLRQGGTKAYFSALYEQAWMAYPLPAIYTGEDLRSYREWLSADGWEGKFSIAGSFVSQRVEDYYVTPYDLGYGHIVKFDHDFIGREALEELAKNPQRKKVTLVWNNDDVLRIVGSLLEPGVPYKYLELPVADYGNMVHRDEVRTRDGQLIGLSTYTGYTANERKILSIAMLETGHTAPGEEVTILWGEPDGGSRKPRVELHQQTLVRATVAPAPYASAVQQMMRSVVGPSAER
jgi:vanillate/3-O-methylgallate O-demethylase